MKVLFKLKIPGLIKKILGILLIIVLVFLMIDVIFPFRPKPEYSQVIYAEDGSILYCFLNNGQKWRIKTELNEITPQLQKIIIYKEDKYFSYHFGINPFAIARAFVKNIIRGKRISGASTITMQIVRMLEPKRRTYFNKFLEMFRAIQLEIHYSKKEILQLYLNYLPYGSNLEGVKSASILYFQQKPEALSLAQMVTLAIIPNKPGTLKIGQNNSYIVAYRNKWLKYFQKSGLFPKKQIQDALSEPLDAYRHTAPNFAPHLAFYLRDKYPGKETVRTFIKPEFQQKTEKIVYNYIRGLKSMNITNAAVLIINNRKKAVVAYVGSADFNDCDCQGQVDGTQSIRSPGSTLKPYLYALAIDRGLITPKTIMYDVPVNYNGYSPDNYDGKFHGIMTMETA
jgi:penicillin-binding protein 1C